MTYNIFHLPNWRDKRWLQACIHLTYALVARYGFNFESSIANLFGTLAVCMVIDLIISRLLYQKPNNILTSTIIAFGCSLMIYSPSIWPYIGAVFAAICSKAFLRYNGRHVFNPSNFGIIAMLALFPNWTVTSGNLFSGYWVPSMAFFILGTINVVWARQTLISFTWLIAFVLFNYVRGVIIDSPFQLSLLVLNPLIILFTFHMITDPMTTPRTTFFRILFGLSVAAFDVALRFYGVIGSQFYALFIISAFMPFIWEIEAKSDWAKHPIKTLKLALTR